MSNEKMREEFEVWAVEGWPGERLAKFANGDYCGHTLNFCWLAWQASQDVLLKRQLREQEEFLDHLADYDHEDRLND